MRASSRGQSTVEYLLATSVIAVALALALGVVYQAVSGGTDGLASSLASELTDGDMQD